VVSPVYTIGHSSHPLAHFLNLLAAHEITALADVRSVPYSKFNAQFNRDALPPLLKERGIKYVFLGEELGARSQDPTVYKNGVVQYRLLAKTELFRSGIQRVMRGRLQYRIALMCAEKDPIDCHRAILVARELEAEGVPVEHIHRDGRLESHSHAIDRLIDRLDFSEGLLVSGDLLIAEAYRLQEARIAYSGLAGHGPRRRGAPQPTRT